MAIVVLPAAPGPRSHEGDVFLFAALGAKHAFRDREGRRHEGFLLVRDGDSFLYMDSGPLSDFAEFVLALKDVDIKGASYLDDASNAWVDFRPEAHALVATAATDEDELAVERCLDAASIAHVPGGVDPCRVWVAAHDADAARAALTAAGGALAVTRWDMRSYREPGDGWYAVARFTPSGDGLLVGYGDTLFELDLADGNCRQEYDLSGLLTPRYDEWALEQALYTPDGRHLVAALHCTDGASLAGAAAVFDVRSGERLATLTKPREWAPGGVGQGVHAALRSDGARLCLLDDGRLSVRRMPGGEELASTAVESFLGPVAWGEDDEAIVVVTYGGIATFDAATLEPRATLLPPSWPRSRWADVVSNVGPFAACFDVTPLPSGATLLTDRHDHDILWRSPDAREAITTSAGVPPVELLHWRADGSRALPAPPSPWGVAGAPAPRAVLSRDGRRVAWRSGPEVIVTPAWW